MYTPSLSLFQRSADSIWTDPYISRNLLQAHLDESSDGASRNKADREKTLQWILRQIPPGGAVLDLGCGPGLYALELAKKQHTVRGLDFNKVSIDYAAAHNSMDGFTEYIYGDYLKEPFGDGYSAAIMIYCDFGALIPEEQKMLLGKIQSALPKGGLFLFDVFGKRLKDSKPTGKTWSLSGGGGFWAEEPYFLLEEFQHFEEADAIGTRYFIIPQEHGAAKECILWDQYYDSQSIRHLLEPCGFSVKTIEKNIIENSNFTSGDVLFVAAEKQ
ncbi:class I SAM-dependent methyltransferase [Breznakiella homolactica]|uniref:Class I SAM-dependent methyltransferase n=1 Tax=Breznakiella homolactica TaxID=2798577 RepID=A0A7T7XJK4_9SPIR|nr:class I SAM-dependent methyltransferase [Breznakiella homolactica]QQO07363.1 class I SAM-dependent methyltransferase [Breznakiella homolactica]